MKILRNLKKRKKNKWNSERPQSSEDGQQIKNNSKKSEVDK